MSTDPIGSESPFGDGDHRPESAAAEDFLGLGDDSGASEAPSDADDEDSWTLSPPSIDDFDELDEDAFGDSPEETPLQGLAPLEPASVDEAEDDFESGQTLALDDEPDDASIVLESRVPSSEEYIEQVNAGSEDLGLHEEGYDSEDTLNIEFDGDLAGQGEIDEQSWLMEFEGGDEEGQEDPAELFDLETESEEYDEEYDEEYEEEYVDADERSPWFARAVIAAISVAAGVVGAKFLPFGDSPAQIQPRVAQNTTNQPAPQPQPNQPVPPQPVVDTTPAPIGVAVVEPQPVGQTPGPQAPGNLPPQIEVNVPQTDPNIDRRTVELPVEDMVLLADEADEHVRQATANEMSGMWLGATVPLDAIGANARMLTPNVGRVRVVLAGGEVFEGKLYAIGEKKVWLTTELGKMALLDWQIDRIDHILSTEGSAVLGEDGSQDLAGLKSVRVRTAGGVFYGKLLSREGNSVTLVTSTGARVTLEDAQVEIAGRSHTRLIDASGALDDEPEEVDGE